MYQIHNFPCFSTPVSGCLDHIQFSKNLKKKKKKDFNKPADKDGPQKGAFSGNPRIQETGGTICGTERGRRSFWVWQDDDLIGVTLGRHVDLETQAVEGEHVKLLTELEPVSPSTYCINNQSRQLSLRSLTAVHTLNPHWRAPTLFLLGGGVDCELLTISWVGVSARVDSACCGELQL